MNTIKKGFTLIELMVVIVILGILTVVIAPKIPYLVRKAHEAATKGGLATLRSALNIYFADNNGRYPAGPFTDNNIHYDQQNIYKPCLSPKYLKKWPACYCPPHHKRIVDNQLTIDHYPYVDVGLDISGCDGEWGYVGLATSPEWGTIFVECTHKDLSGTEWYKY